MVLHEPSRLVLCHATGFCRQVWYPVIDHLRLSLPQSVAQIVCFDFSGHGDKGAEPVHAEWERWQPQNVHDAIEEAEERRGSSGVDVFDIHPELVRANDKLTNIAIGHSMGGAGAILAELKRPKTFDHIIAFEPVVWQRIGNSGFAERAERRRYQWQSQEEALAYFLSRSLYSSWSEDVLQAYVEGGLEKCAGGVRLKCKPWVEAAVYRGDNEAFQNLHTLSCPVTICVGEKTDIGGLDNFYEVANRICNSELHVFPGGSHFLPQEEPKTFAAFLTNKLSVHGKL